MIQQNNEEICKRIQEIYSKVLTAAQFSGRKLDDIQIMAVTKTVAPEKINLAYKNGICLFGENRVQEYLGKCEEYSFQSDMVHFIGHLQTNKVKYIINKVSCIESVSSVKLAKIINKNALQINKIMPVFLEVNIADEDTKTGFSPSELMESVLQISELSNLSLCGLMCIPKKDEGEYWFSKMEELFHDFQSKKLFHTDFRFLSMGMSEDYEAAIRHGSNIIRLGRVIFGNRN